MKNFMLVVMLLTGFLAHSAEKKVSDLPLLNQSSWDASDLFVISDLSAGASRKTTVGDFDGRYYLKSAPITIAQGGTGVTTQQAAINALTLPVTSGRYLRSNGVNASMDFIYANELSGNVAIANGGTGQSTKAAGFDALSPMNAGGDLIYGGSGGTGTRLANGSAGNILRSAGGTSAPAWTTATYPATTTINNILFSSASNTISEISSANTSALITNSSGVPSFTSGTTANRLLRTNGSAVSFAQADLTSDVTGALPIANGGTNNGSLAVTAGGVLYTDGSKAVNVGAGTSGFYLKSNGSSAPSWAAVTTGSNAVVSVTTTYAVLTTDYQINASASGGAFTITLPTAVGASGKEYVIKRTDQTLANIITLATTSSQTIDGVTTKTLATQYESWKVISDGANWFVSEHRASAPASTWTPTLAGFGTVSNLSAVWYRSGLDLVYEVAFTAGTVSAVPATFSLPSGLTTASNLAVDPSTGYMIVGQVARNVTSSSVNPSIAPVSSSVLYIGAYGSGSFKPTAPLNGSDYSASSNTTTWSGRVRIANWTE